jgi:hypothetical protein
MVLLEFAEPLPGGESDPKTLQDSNPLSKFLPVGKYPLEQRIENKKRGIGQQKHPYLGV